MEVEGQAQIADSFHTRFIFLNGDPERIEETALIGGGPEKKKTSMCYILSI